ncbi:unnamed protein product [Amoebophrya sp. A120]|nr:unnamed protein product [Amoebophrya sp. A120]|eukprot:GSA120T00001929001.1
MKLFGLSKSRGIFADGATEDHGPPEPHDCANGKMRVDSAARCVVYAENCGRYAILGKKERKSSGDSTNDEPLMRIYAKTTSEALQMIELRPQVKNEKQRGVVEAYFSPLGNFIATYEHYVKSGGNNANLWYLDWAKSEAVCVDGCTIQTLKPSLNWPAWKLSAGEEFCCRAVGNGLNVVDLRSLTLCKTFWKKRTTGDAGAASGLPTGEEVSQAFQSDLNRKKLALPNISQFEISNGVLGCTASTQSDACPFYVSKNNFSSPGSHLLPATAATIRSLLEEEGGESPAADQQSRFFVAAFVPEAKAQPGKVSLFELTADTNAALQRPVSSKSFYNASSVLLRWNMSKLPAAVLVFSGQDYTKGDSLDCETSYYGATTLFHLSCSETSSGPVNLGEIQTAAWNPRRNEFLVLEGRTLPCSLSLISGANPSKTLQQIVPDKSLRRNHIAWSPSGDHFVLAGLGNLAGDLDFYHNANHGTKKPPQFSKIRTANFNRCTNIEYDRFGLSVLCSTLAPRIRSECSFRLYDFAGGLTLDSGSSTAATADVSTGAVKPLEADDQLYGITFADCVTGSDWKKTDMTDLTSVVFPEAVIIAAKKLGDETAGKGLSTSNGVPEHMKKAYVPPHLRNVKIEPAGGGPSGTKAAAKNKPKAKKEPKQTQQPPAEAEFSPSSRTNEKQKEQQVPEQASVTAAEVLPNKKPLLEEVMAIHDDEQKQKKAKALKKKLTQIEKLKEKSELSAEEKEKVATEKELNEALAYLGC